MALRWALERLNLLEKKAAEFDADLAQSDKARQNAQMEAEAARKTLSEREEYFKKVEDMTILTPDSKAGVEAVAKRGLENERAFEAVLNGLKRRLALAEDAARRSQSMTESREALLTERERQWLKEKEDLISRHAATGRGAERAWERQKTELMDELRGLREKFNNQLSGAIELERRATEAEEAAAQAKSSLESQKSILAETDRALMRERSELSNRIRLLESAESDRAEEAVRRAAAGWSEEKTRLLAEIDIWRQKYQSQMTGLLDLERRAIAAEETSRRTDNTARVKETSLAEAEAAWLREKAELASRLRDAEERRAAELREAAGNSSQDEKRHVLELQKAVEDERQTGEKRLAKLQAELESLRLHSREQLAALRKLEEQIAAIERRRGQAQAELADRERKLEARSKELAALAKVLEAKLS
ncbi:MAG: hypothetical protein HZB91_04735 [Elusimicrobia bacterium]|nr:hypothetical protein [Elusimicrobiota bacterium]